MAKPKLSAKEIEKRRQELLAAGAIETSPGVFDTTPIKMAGNRAIKGIAKAGRTIASGGRAVVNEVTAGYDRLPRGVQIAAGLYNPLLGSAQLANATRRSFTPSTENLNPEPQTVAGRTTEASPVAPQPPPQHVQQAMPPASAASPAPDNYDAEYQRQVATSPGGGIGPAAFKQNPINDTSYEDQGFSRRDNARNNFLADTTGKGVQVVNPMGGTNAIGDKWQAWGTQAKGAPAPAAVAVNDGRIHWENLGSHYQKPGIQPAQTAVAASEPAMSPDIMADMDSLAGPSEGTSIGPASTPPVVQQEPKAQPTQGFEKNMDAAKEAVAKGTQAPGQRQQSTAKTVFGPAKSPYDLPGSRSWRSGSNPNAIKPAQGGVAMPNPRSNPVRMPGTYPSINDRLRSYDPNFEA